MGVSNFALSAQAPCRLSAQRRSGLVCRAQAAPKPKSAPANPKNPIGIHSQVWVGGWSKQEAEKAISGTKDAGYDLIERTAESSYSSYSFFPARVLGSVRVAEGYSP